MSVTRRGPSPSGSRTRRRTPPRHASPVPRAWHRPAGPVGELDDEIAAGVVHDDDRPDEPGRVGGRRGGGAARPAGQRQPDAAFPHDEVELVAARAHGDQLHVLAAGDVDLEGRAERAEIHVFHRRTDEHEVGVADLDPPGPPGGDRRRQRLDPDGSQPDPHGQRVAAVGRLERGRNRARRRLDDEMVRRDEPVVDGAQHGAAQTVAARLGTRPVGVQKVHPQVAALAGR